MLTISDGSGVHFPEDTPPGMLGQLLETIEPQGNDPSRHWFCTPPRPVNMVRGTPHASGNPSRICEISGLAPGSPVTIG
ncbi:Uncharacterised protein [Mycobacteroides abscessus]|nr:Uncharacterised protein [Mycobacteroides abscessus]